MIVQSFNYVTTRSHFIQFVNTFIISDSFLLPINNYFDSTDSFTFIVHDFSKDRKSDYLKWFNVKWFSFNECLNYFWLYLKLWLVLTVLCYYLILTRLNVRELVFAVGISNNLLKSVLRFDCDFGITRMYKDWNIGHRIIVGQNLSCNRESSDFKEVLLTFESCFPQEITFNWFFLQGKIFITNDTQNVRRRNCDIFELYLSLNVSYLSVKQCGSPILNLSL